MGNRQVELINYLNHQLMGRQGVLALYMKGSVADGTDDEYSDVDYYCLVTEAIYDEMLNDRHDIVKGYKPVLYYSLVCFQYPQIIAIYDNDLHLDFYLTKDKPEEGNGKIVSLYDPKDILRNYVVNEKSITDDYIIELMEDVVYTFHELQIAIKRNDPVWASRLESHIIADLTMILDYLFPISRPVLHMKGAYFRMPKQVKMRFDEILTCRDQMLNVINLAELADQVYGLLNERLQHQIDRRYLDYVLTLNK